MAKKASKPNALAAELDDIKRDKESKLNLGDGSSIKRALDDAAAAEVISEGYSENHALSNIKIGVGIATCLLAAVAQLYPAKYPDNAGLLKVCVGLYVLATMTLNIVLSGIEGDAFFISTPKGKRTLCITSKLPRYSERYTLTLGSKPGACSRGPLRAVVSQELQITDYFTTDGSLLEARFRKVVAALLKKYESGANVGSPQLELKLNKVVKGLQQKHSNGAGRKRE